MKTKIRANNGEPRFGGACSGRPRRAMGKARGRRALGTQCASSLCGWDFKRARKREDDMIGRGA